MLGNTRGVILKAGNGAQDRRESSLSVITERELQHGSPWPSPKDRRQRLVLLSSRSFALRYCWLRYPRKKRPVLGLA